MKKRDEILDGLVSTLTGALDRIERQAAAAGLRGDTVELFKDVKLIVDTKEIIAAIQQLRAEAATAKKQVDQQADTIRELGRIKTLTEQVNSQAMSEKDTQVRWMEWIAGLVNNGRVYYVEREGATLVAKHSMGNIVARWPGQLRDGWRHWDKIKEAVK